MKWFIKCLRLYAVFKGRARRSEYWYFLLFNTAFGNMASLLDRLLTRSGRFGWIYTAYALVMLLPSLAVCVRRLHDTGRSGWQLMWYYIVGIAGIASSFVIPNRKEMPAVFLPVLFAYCAAMITWAVIFLVRLCTDSRPGTNRYGANPKGVGE